MLRVGLAPGAVKAYPVTSFNVDQVDDHGCTEGLSSLGDHRLPRPSRHQEEKAVSLTWANAWPKLSYDKHSCPRHHCPPATLAPGRWAMPGPTGMDPIGGASINTSICW